MSFFNFNSYNNNRSASSVSVADYVNKKLQKINDKYFKNIEKSLNFYYNDKNGNININNKIDILHLYKSEQNKLNYYFLNNFSNDFLKKVFSINNSNLIYDILNIYRLILEYNYDKLKKNLKNSNIIDIYEYIYFIINNNENTIIATFNSTNDLITLINNIKEININSIGFYKKNYKLEYIINKSYSYDYYILFYLLDKVSFKNENKFFNKNTNPINIEKLEAVMLRDFTRVSHKIVVNDIETDYKLNNIQNATSFENEKDKLGQQFLEDIKKNISISLKTNNSNLINDTYIKILQSISQTIAAKLLYYSEKIYTRPYLIDKRQEKEKNIIISKNNYTKFTITFVKNNILINCKFDKTSSVLDIVNEINIDFRKNTLKEKIIFNWKDKASKKNILFNDSANSEIESLKKIEKQIYNILKLNNRKINKNTVAYIRNKILNYTINNT